MIRLERVFALVLRQFFLMRGSIARITPLFAWAAVDIVLWGFLTRYLSSFTQTGYNFVAVILGAVLFWDFFIRLMQGVAMAFLEDVWSRNFLNIFAAPITLTEYLIALVISSIGTSLVGLVVMLLLAGVCFGLSILTYGLLVLPAVLILFLFGIALGILGSALVLRLGPAAEWFIWPIPAFLSPFVGVLYPLSTLPTWMQWIGQILPPSYIFENIRALLAGGSISWGALFGATVLCGFYVLLACWIFSRTYRHVVNSGVLARYSAESLN